MYYLYKPTPFFPSPIRTHTLAARSISYLYIWTCFKILILTFKAIHGLAPEYISDLISVKGVSKYSLRSNGGLLLHQPRARLRKTLGDRSFTSPAPTLWNKLPAHLRNMDNFINFKSGLKTHIFRIAF